MISCKLTNEFFIFFLKKKWNISLALFAPWHKKLKVSMISIPPRKHIFCWVVFFQNMILLVVVRWQKEPPVVWRRRRCLISFLLSKCVSLLVVVAFTWWRYIYIYVQQIQHLLNSVCPARSPFDLPSTHRARVWRTYWATFYVHAFWPQWVTCWCCCFSFWPTRAMSRWVSRTQPPPRTGRTKKTNVWWVLVFVRMALLVGHSHIIILVLYQCCVTKTVVIISLQCLMYAMCGLSSW